MKDEGVVFVPLSAATTTIPEPGMQRQVLAYNQKVMLVRHHFSKGWEGSAHSHPHEQIVYVVTGCILFTAAGRTIEMHSGDSILVECNVEHQATALEDSEVLDVFVPYRSDYAQ
jgi:quercetin dioxygenase-like cupin family protein